MLNVNLRNKDNIRYEDLKYLKGVRTINLRECISKMIKESYENIIFEKKLEIQGVGYKANVEGDGLLIEVGYSHPIQFSKPQGIDFLLEVILELKNNSKAFFVLVGSGTETKRIIEWFKVKKPENALFINELNQEDYDILLQV
jgi:hypothetical protein